MAIAKGYVNNFDTMMRAARDGRLAIVEGRERATGIVRVMIAAIGEQDGEYVITPFGHLCDTDPYEFYDPPNPEGGFYGEKDSQA